MNLEDQLTKLYGLPRSEFVPARNELAKQLRGSGERAEADEVRALEKPSLPAWAINQLQRSDQEAVRRLARAGEKIGEIQASALAGRAAAGLREASEEQLAAVADLVSRARRDLGDELSADALDRVEVALRNASTDETSRSLLLAGRLVDEPQAAGFGAFAGVPVATERSKRKPSKKADDGKKARVRDLREKVAEARRAVAASEKEAREAERAAARAEKEAEKMRNRLSKLEGELENAAKE